MVEILTTSIVAAPAVLAGLGLLLRRPAREVSALAVVGSLASAASAAWLAAQPFRGSAVVARWSPELLVSLGWRVETITLALAILVALVGALVLQYAAAYFDDSESARDTIALLALFETSMLGLVLADNLYVLFVFWELTGIASFFLIASDRGNPAAFAAARRALLITSAGALPMLVGIIYLASVTGTASLSALLEIELGAGECTVALALFLPAVLTKSAQVPLHSWLPGAMTAPTPVSAYLHSATMVKAGVILLLYLYPLLGGSPLWTTVLVPIGAVTCLWGSFRALGEADVKLLMAWSTVSQLGLLTLTIGLGTDLAIRAAVLHVFAHAVFKAGLFLTVGGIDKSAGTRSFFELGGLRRSTPLLFLLAAVLAGSMAGIPPLAGFLSKELILKKVMLTELWVHAVAITAIALGSVGTVAYSSRFVIEVFLGQPRGSRSSRKRLGPALIAAPAVLAGVTLAAGPGAAWVDRWFLEPVTASVIGRVLPEVTPLSLWYGVNAALLLSVAIVTIGYVSDRIIGLRMLPRGFSALSGERIFDLLLDGSQRLGARFSRLLSAGHPSIYLGLALGVGVLAAVPLAAEALAGGAIAPPHPAGLVTVLLLAAVLTAILRVRDRLARVLLVSAAGFAVAFLYRLLNAPDLMLTQLLVEVLVTIFFALSLRGLPSEAASGERRSGGRWVRRPLAIGAGLLAGSLVLALGRSEAPTHIQDFYRAAAPELAKGLNVVNVILTDFRALDTLMETLVVVLAALGVAGLLRGRERSWARTPSSATAAAGTTGLLPTMSRLILPLAGVLAASLLIKGHDEPGGGFVAGLALAIAAILSTVTVAGIRGRGSAGGLALVGAAILLLSLLGSLLLVQPGLTHAHGELRLFGTGWKWHTALLFDVGVVLAVAGSVAAATRALWPSPAMPSATGDGRVES